MFAKVRKVDLSGYKRVLVVSDIHGDADGFQLFLEHVCLREEDALIIVGDICERGRQSLPLLRLVMELCRGGNVFMVSGNNDTIFDWWLDDDEGIHGYINSVKKSIVLEMAEQLGMSTKTLENVIVLKQTVWEKFQEEITFLRTLPDIIDTELAIFVHAGIRPGSLYEQDRDYCLREPAFAQSAPTFDKPVIVGHWPASNYSGNIINVNVLFKENNVISIDGGNCMKSWRQINYLMINPKTSKIESDFIDRCRRIEILEKQDASDNPITLLYPNTLVEIKGVEGTKTICYVPYLEREMMLPSDRIYEYKGHTYSYDFTTYCLSVEKGEIVSFCEETKDGMLVKRNGIVGLYKGAYRFV